MKTFVFDVMLNGRFICTLKYEYSPLFPIDFEELEKFVLKKRPTLKGKDLEVKRMVQKEFRKPPRYMVGDIVYSHGFICVVCSVYPFNIDYSYDLKVIDGQSLGKICQNDIMHVHIWEEFLKKNGWTCYRSEGECFGHRWYKHQEYPFTLRYNNFLGICGVSFNDGKDDTVMIKGVDELQHILFGLQLDSNLKI